jgi:uncharacterized protein (TIGR02246 family)
MRKIPLVTIPALLVLVATGCEPSVPEAPARTDQQVQADVEALRSQWQELANADDLAGVVATYTEDAVYIDQYGTVHDGRTAISTAFEQSLPLVSGYEIQTSGTVFGGDMVAAHGTWTATMTTSAGSTAMNGLWVVVSLYQPDGSLKIRIHQGMIPATPPAM